ncbi:hypothetical protein CLOACE_17190 [Clostridium acetireducens DSM 10703]|jgi:uncharacterized protein YrzB (UPF0473 family)|uniref:Uncharacterized protein n=1 Tax=Clostridium acetireducens DSM 10703 TaxID=1121290 RepID=A0A1E8EXM6_9CLOT|nr:DUF1292 domain-containing protein [Clostridium acetireducens]OFI05423.1 hypothetical protein CLOACE_17190 [Clostridium acetireducens DSM 10703]
MDNNADSVVLRDEEGKDIEFNIITKLDIKDNEYIIVCPKYENVDEAIALKIDKDSEGKDILMTIEDEEEFDMVSEAYEILFAEDSSY